MPEDCGIHPRLPRPHLGRIRDIVRHPKGYGAVILVNVIGALLALVTLSSRSAWPQGVQGGSPRHVRHGQGQEKRHL